MNELTKLIRGDMKPALGVTEPGAIAFAVSKARSYVGGKIAGVDLTLNSGMYKNAFTCGIPGSNFCGMSLRPPWESWRGIRTRVWSVWRM